MADSHTATALLVGGKSTRMGEDKSLLICEPSSDPLYLTQLEKLRQLSSLPVLLSVRSGQEFQDLNPDVEIVPDSVADQGPLGALATCLEKATANHLLILAVDLPQISVAFLQELISYAQKTGLGIVPRMNDRWEPLAAVYPRNLLPQLQKHLAANQLSLQRFIDEAVADGNLIARDITIQEKPLFSNLNTPEDLESLKQNEYTPTDVQRWERLTGPTEKPTFSA